MPTPPLPCHISESLQTKDAVSNVNYPDERSTRLAALSSEPGANFTDAKLERGRSLRTPDIQLSPIFEVDESNGATAVLLRATGSRKSNMAAVKTKAAITLNGLR